MFRFQNIALAALLATGCGGNWSNSDLDFVNALPQKAALKSKIPVSTTTSPLEGISTRTDPLVGDPSTAYADAKNASTQFNGIIDGLLGVVELIRQLPPTTRTATGRVWGPYDDSKNPGFQFQLAIDQSTDDPQQFHWAISSRQTSGTLFTVVDGDFKATQSLKKGEGTMVMHVKDFRDRLSTDEGLKQMDLIEMAYTTDAFPILEKMTFTLAPGASSAFSKVGYTYQEQQDASGTIAFELRSPTNVQTTAVEINSSWLPSGAGVSTGIVTEGTFLGFKVTECWSTAFTTTFRSESWVGGQTVGAQSDCVTVPGF